MGILSKTSRKLIFAPYYDSGFAFADTWIQQGLQHLQLLIGHLCHQDQVGNLLHINIDTLQILLGYPLPPLSYPYKDIAPIAPSSWLTTTWEFLDDINGSVTLSDPLIIPLNQEGDCHLMPTVLSHLFHTPNPLLSKPDLQKFNLCCIYLQVITLSDITTSLGTEINCHFWNGHRSSQKSSLSWPNQIHQICPSSTCWGIWCKTLHLFFTDSAKSKRILPANCLHRWLPNSKSHQLWPTYMDPTTSQLFTRLVGSSTYIIYQP